VLHPAIWQAGLGGVFGRTALIAGVAFALALISLALRDRAGRGVAWLALAGVGLALAASGHASAAEPQILMRPAVFLHAVGIAAWTGALFPLSVAVLGPGGASVLDRFSRRIPVYDGELVLDPSKPDGTPRKLMDVTRMHSLGWKAKTSLDTGLRSSYRDFISRYATERRARIDV
jgi:hypothetical protein